MPNPWHDEIGRFAPKGTGTMVGERLSEIAGRVSGDAADRLYDLADEAHALNPGAVADRVRDIAREVDSDSAYQDLQDLAYELIEGKVSLKGGEKPPTREEKRNIKTNKDKANPPKNTGPLPWLR